MKASEFEQAIKGCFADVGGGIPTQSNINQMMTLLHMKADSKLTRRQLFKFLWRIITLINKEHSKG